MEWLGWRPSEFGSWLASAYIQIEHLTLLQTNALVGLSGITLLIAAVAALLAVVLSTPNPRRWLPARAALGGLLLAATSYGSMRIFTAQTGPMVTVSGGVSDLQFTPGNLLTVATVTANNDALFGRSQLAAQRGAKLEVWNEGATLVHPDGESALLTRARRFAAAAKVNLVLACIVPTDPSGATFENKFIWMTPGGPLETYHKLHPVPGEGGGPGKQPGAVHLRPYGAVADAICYVCEFPTPGLHHGRHGAGLPVVPSSDWRGIDQYHTQMARAAGRSPQHGCAQRSKYWASWGLSVISACSVSVLT